MDIPRPESPINKVLPSRMDNDLLVYYKRLGTISRNNTNIDEYLKDARAQYDAKTVHIRNANDFKNMSDSGMILVIEPPETTQILDGKEVIEWDFEAIVKCKPVAIVVRYAIDGSSGGRMLHRMLRHFGAPAIDLDDEKITANAGRYNERNTVTQIARFENRMAIKKEMKGLRYWLKYAHTIGDDYTVAYLTNKNYGKPELSEFSIHNGVVAQELD